MLPTEATTEVKRTPSKVTEYESPVAGVPLILTLVTCLVLVTVPEVATIFGEFGA